MSKEGEFTPCQLQYLQNMWPRNRVPLEATSNIHISTHPLACPNSSRVFGLCIVLVTGLDGVHKTMGQNWPGLALTRIARWFRPAVRHRHVPVAVHRPFNGLAGVGAGVVAW
eukprot:1212128-Amphidinium_carterae.1